MLYNFPKIERIEDVLPAIKGRDEFIVAERDGFTVINYNVGFEDTFTIDEDDLMANYGRAIPKGVMRRECRGIIFYPDGRIMSRPFHKFFNVGEREETQLHSIDMSQPHTIMEKMDGSMIRPMIVNGKLRLGTKMGITDTSIAAEQALEANTGEQFEDVLDFLDGLVRDHVTPLFEFIAPDNRIVIRYDEPELVLLGLRSNFDGGYMAYEGKKGKRLAELFRPAPEYGTVDGSFEEYIERQRDKEGREGDIIRFGNGHMLKIKNDWYVRIHKVKDKIRTDRHVLALLLNNDLDDVYPHLDKDDFDRVKQYERDFHTAYKKTLEKAERNASILVEMAGGDKKRLAVDVIPDSELNKNWHHFVFGYADGKDMNDMLMARVHKGLGNTVKYNELAEFLGLAADNGEDE